MLEPRRAVRTARRGEPHRRRAPRLGCAGVVATGDAITPAARSRARRGEGQRLRDEILVAATQVLADTGSEQAMSIRAVADAAGVTPPSIYMHFADKTDLVYAVCERHFAELDAHVEAALVGITDPVERLA